MSRLDVLSRLPRDVRKLVEQLLDVGGRVEWRTSHASVHVFAPDGSWMAVLSTTPRNERGAVSRMRTVLRRCGVNP